MTSPWKSHVVLSGSIEHALLSSASAEIARTGPQLLTLAIAQGLRRYDDVTLRTALARLLISAEVNDGRMIG
ncbi:hypothetical protein [Deinococcus alpinitundrae]|uniref:hypothetical protein n=1 Tax=Deinococcus alpinitundrae TaxID=468913 RepID=UPI001379F966|nr:hypothetical protein [Deinococcus alpinitundrae]